MFFIIYGIFVSDQMLGSLVNSPGYGTRIENHPDQRGELVHYIAREFYTGVDRRELCDMFYQVRRSFYVRLITGRNLWAFLLADGNVPVPRAKPSSAEIRSDERWGLP
jgi:hypothetical protein